MMWNKPESVRCIIKLMDACTQCRQIFRAVSGSLTEQAYAELVETVFEKLDRFGIELRNEIRRLGQTADFSSFRFESIPNESEILALRRTLDYYEHALHARISTHTRAMIGRQQSDLQQAYEQLVSLHRAA
jgi:hypothetical protein